VLCDLIGRTITNTIAGIGVMPALAQAPPQQQIQVALPPEIQAALMQAAKAQAQ
jgi:hypothetical protein